MTRIRIPQGSRLLLAALLAMPAVPHLAAQELQTPAEASGFTKYTPYSEMMSYLQALVGRSPELRMGLYGQTRLGRDLPYLVFSRPAVSEPWEAWALGKPIVVLNANVHGGERTLRESLLILMREMATPGTEAYGYLDHLVIVVAPQINPDGFEASPGGTRGNSWGIDMNRDWIKREQPSLANYALNVINRWAPHLFVDGHNGGSFPYQLTWQCPSHAEPDQRITQLCDTEIFPALNRKLGTAGMKGWYYQAGNANRWNGGGYDARIGRNYGGFANTIGILFESPPGQPMATGVQAGILGFKGVLEYTRDNAAKVMMTVERARRETIEMGQRAEGNVVVEMRYGPQPYRVTYEIGVREGTTQRAVQVSNDSLMTLPVITKTRPRPYAYVLPREAVDAVAMLRRNAIVVEELLEPMQAEVQAYVVEGVGFEQAYNHSAAVRLKLADQTQTVTRTFPAGTFVVRTGQVLGRVAAHMLEPETNDNVIYWNTMDAWLPLNRLLPPAARAGDDEEAPPGPPQGGAQQGPPLVPIFKIMTPRPIAGRMVP
ncbi:MAG: M14 family zinc carboxypeptidase [Gemmatimonadota bacterium]|nr:M14 family zinc carboxypeptidase [Gemmatimonadota bacterium]